MKCRSLSGNEYAAYEANSYLALPVGVNVDQGKGGCTSCGLIRFPDLNEVCTKNC